MGEIQALTAHQAHNNVTEQRNESMEKTHNPHYKGFGMSFYDTCDWRTIMYSLIPSSSQQPVFWRLNLCRYNGISRSKQEHVRSPSLSFHTGCPYYITSSTSLSLTNKHMHRPVRGKQFLCLIWMHLNVQTFVWCCPAGFHLFAAFCFYYFSLVSMVTNYSRHFSSE